LAAVACAPLRAEAQSGVAARAPAAVAAGRVVRIGAADSLPAAGARVVLHRIGRTGQGPLDSALTDAAGRFRFSFPADTTALHILTARHAGIQYFSEPVATNPAAPDTAIVLLVHDTAASAPVSLEARHVVISAPGPDGTRGVVELVTLHNPGPLTRVLAAGASAVWTLRIPPAAIGFAVSDGDLSAGAVDRNEDSVLVLAPLAPGDRQVTFEYLLPASADRITIPVDGDVAMLNLFIEEPDARVLAPTLARADSATVIQGREFQRWTGPATGGAQVRVVLPRPSRAGRWALAGLVGAIGVSLLLAAAGVFRRRPALPPPLAAEPILAAIARLDAEHAGRRAETAPDAWARYEAERAELKASLAAALARNNGTP
jgi:hypothetical protein